MIPLFLFDDDYPPPKEKASCLEVLVVFLILLAVTFGSVVGTSYLLIWMFN